ncbi:MAG: sugar ABC transporter permease [Chloroflexi bacterium]|nr:sugar ABC transporter permease [Chloroflexota bacterium]
MEQSAMASNRPVATSRSPGGFGHRIRRSSKLGMIFAAAVTVFYAIVFIIPFGTAIWLSFHNWDYITIPRFVGVRNYVKLFQSAQFWQAVWTTVKFSFTEITVAVTLALLLALMLSRMRGKWEGLYLTLYYLPMITPSVVSVYLWRWLYTPTGGVFNTILKSIGLREQPFLASTQQALWCVTAMIIWMNVGGAAVILLAGIKDIPQAMFDAAKIDGAGFWQMFFKIIIPLIQPVLVYQIVVSVIGTVQMFDPFFLMPGPGNSTRTLAPYAYQLGFQTLNLGFGAATSMFIFLMLLVATIFQLQRWQVNWEY